MEVITQDADIIKTLIELFGKHRLQPGPLTFPARYGSNWSGFS